MFIVNVDIYKGKEKDRNISVRYYREFFITEIALNNVRIIAEK